MKVQDARNLRWFYREKGDCAAWSDYDRWVKENPQEAGELQRLVNARNDYERLILMYLHDLADKAGEQEDDS